MADLQLADLESKVRRVRQRQFAQTFLLALPWCLTGGLVLAAAWWLVQPWLPIALAWWQPFLAALGLGLIAAAAWTIYRRPGHVDSALALDGAFGLKERVTTALTLNGDLRDTPAGVALLEDTEKHVAGLDVAARFPLRLERWAALVPAAALLFALLVAFYHPTPGESGQGESPGSQAKKEDPLVDKQLLEQLKQERKQRPKERTTEQTEQLDAELDKIIDRLANAEKQPDVQLAIQDMTQAAEQIRKRQEELAKLKDVNSKLKNDPDLKKQDDGPTKDLKDALSKADLEKAKEEVKKLADDLKNGKLSEEQKKEMEKKLKEMQEKLKDLAEQKQRREKIANSDMDPEEKKRELAKIDKECQNLKELSELADKLGLCQQCLQQGNSDQAAEALQAALDKLNEMELDQKELEKLQQMAADLDKLKECSH
jgi:hypothetical protein